jgi:hypothetical protein
LIAGHQICQRSRLADIVTPIRLPRLRNSTPAFLKALRIAARLAGESGNRYSDKYKGN